ncbi:MAG: copper resistance protein CopC [Acidimicrobiia bacterium]
MKRSLAVALLVASFLGLLATPAFAHASLDSSSPGAGQTVAESPASVELSFDESVQVGLGGMKVFDSSGHELDTSSPRHPGDDPSRVSVGLPHLRAGSYVVTWRVLSDDSHPVRGAFVFNVERPTASKNVSGLSVILLRRESGDRAVGFLYGLARFAAFAGLLLLVGSVVFIVSVWPAGRFERRTRHLVAAGWWAAFAGTVLGLAIDGPYVAARGLGAVTDWSLFADAMDTRFAKVWLARLVLLLLAVPLVRVLFRAGDDDRLPRWWPAAAGVVALWLLGTPALAGHAGTGSWPAVSVAVDTLHVTAAAVWLGGLAVLAVAALRSRPAEELRRVVGRFSSIATAAVVVIAATGFLRALREVGSWTDVLSTTYGRLLALKLLGFAVMLALAGVSRRLVRARVFAPRERPRAVPSRVPVAPGAKGAGDDPGPGADLDTGDGDTSSTASADAHELRRLRRAVAAELLIGIAVLVVTALLVNAAPGESVASGPYAKTLETSKLWFDVQVAPAKAGVNELHLTISDPTGRGATPQNVSVRFALPSHGIAPITIPLERITASHYVAPDANLPIAGDWRMTVAARVGGTDEVAVSDTVTIRRQ